MNYDGQLETPPAVAAPAKHDEVAAYWEKRLEQHRGLAGVGFIGFGAAFNSWMYRVRKAIFVREISRLQADLTQASVLDIGSGTGYWLDVWRTLGAKSITALDFTRVAALNLRREYPGCRVVHEDISGAEAVRTLGEQYDFVSAIDVLFHITSDERFSTAISNVARLLKPRGIFVFSETLPHRECSRSRTQVNRTLNSFSEELRRCGLRIVRRAPMFVIMNTPVDMAWDFPARLWRICMAPLIFFPFLGHLYGPVLYPFEIMLTRILREGPSTELVVCEKA